ncbi:MAG: AAA family ATPase [Acidobacteria bacterium]|nr:AAA family ATPase [Acidobacteriota bacterium]
MSAASVFETASSQSRERLAGGRFFPKCPERVSELGVSQNSLVNLMLKMTLLEGETQLSALSDRLKLHPGVCSQIFQHLRKEQYIEVKGMQGNDYVLTLSATGRAVAQERYRISQYVGPAPVALDAYTEAVRVQTARYKINRARLREVFFDLVLTDETLDQLGPAVLSNSQIFLYGSTGNGKTSIAERLVRVFRDEIFLPYAVEVDGQIIQIYDSVMHNALEAPDGVDPRWLRCRRPCVAVGGEMVQEMLELQFESSLGYYTAPLQMKANNGLFIIDDFGRQMINPRDLLNRWIVPLDRGVDFLTLRTGVKIPVPFETLVVFSTNLDPRQLADEAFLRRIQNKVKIDAISPRVFDEILRRICESEGIRWTEEASEKIRQRCLSDGRSQVLRACYPRDVVLILKNIAEYEGRPPHLDDADIDRAVNLYFAR